MTTTVTVNASCSHDEEVCITESMSKHPDGRQKAPKEHVIQNGETHELVVTDQAVIKVLERSKAPVSNTANGPDTAG